VVGRRHETERSPRGEFLELPATLKIGARRSEGHTRAAEFGRTAAEIVLPQDFGAAFIPSVTTAERQAELIGQIVGEIAEDGIGFGVDICLCERGQPGESGEDADIEQSVRLRVEIVESEQAGERAAIVPQQLKFLADLLVEVSAGHIEIDRRKRIEINRRIAVVLAPGGYRPQRQRAAQLDFCVHRQAVGFHFLFGIVERSARVEDIVEHGRAGYQPGDQPVATTRIAAVLGIVPLDPDEGRFAIAAHLQAHAAAPDILVVVFEARGEIVAETAPRKPRNRAADADQVADRCRSGDHAFRLVVSAVGSANAYRGILRQAARDVFYGPADRVAAIERALRPAQHLDALDIVDIQHRGLRPVEIDVVEIDADALLEPRNGVLLADAADKGRQRRIGGSAGFQRDVGYALPDIGDVERAAP